MSGEGSLFDVPPAAIGRFRVLHQVGAGTSGPVFRAVHPETDAPLAVKLFTLPLAPEQVHPLVEELESLVETMPVVDGACRAVEAGLHGSVPFLVASFAAGDSLDVALKQFGPAALADLVPRLRTLALALDAAADEDILHGALHPRDVLVSEIDTTMSGVGAWPVLMRHGGRLPIRRPYRAPELADSIVSAAGDRFALAALAFEWMTGRRAPSAFVAGDMVPLPGADRDQLALVFARALHADPSGRFDCCEAFVAALAAVEMDPVAADAPRGEPRGRRRGLPPEAAPVPLPLDAFPPEAAAPDDDERDLRLRPAEPAAPETKSDPPLAFPEASRPEPPAAPLAAAVTMRPPAVPLSPTSTLLRESEILGVTRHDVAERGSFRPVLGVVLGAVLGLGLGYLLWGPGSTRPAPAAEQTAAAPPSEPVAAPSTALVPAPEPSTPPAASPAPAPAPASERPAPAPTAPAATPAAAARPASPTGNLLVRSTPAGATVFVDDERRGVTPLTLQRVELGTRRVRVQRDGFVAEDRQITLTRSRPSRSVDVRLSRAAPPARPAASAPAPVSAARTGGLVIESRPTGATVLLNGRQVGTTPLTLDDLQPGTYAVQLQLATFRTATTTVRVVAGARARAAASLESTQEQE